MPDTLEPALEAALLPCPFCGNDSPSEHEFSNSTQIDCRVCGASQPEVRGDEFADHAAEAIAAWNRRASPQAEIDRLRHVAEEAYWLLAWTWQSHMFSAGPALAMEAFAPEVRPMMNKAEQDLFDALIALHPETPNGGDNG